MSQAPIAVGRWMLRAGVYAWTGPNTLLGLLFAPTTLWGGRVEVVAGVVEIHSPAIARVFGLLGIAAMTLGHCVLGASLAILDMSRAHERVHVRQYERWGPAFIPAYLLASLVVWWRGARAYRDNPFEIEARALSRRSGGR